MASPDPPPDRHRQCPLPGRSHLYSHCNNLPAPPADFVDDLNQYLVCFPWPTCCRESNHPIASRQYPPPVASCLSALPCPPLPLATMTRLPADDSFFPTPALDTDQLLSSTSGTPSAQASSSVISPLSLPGAAHYFERAPRASATSHPQPGTHHKFPLMTGETCGPPQAQPPNFLSPHLTPIPSHAQYQLQFQRHPQQRAASLSPTRRFFARGTSKMDGQGSSDVDLPPRSTPGIPVPVDTISGTGSGLITIRRPAVRTTSTENSSGESHPLSLE